MLGRAEPEGPAQEMEQQRVLRAATELRGRLAAAKERCDAMDLNLQALLLRRQRREQAAAADGHLGGAGQRNGRRQNGGSQTGQQDAVEIAIHDLFGDSDSNEEAANGSRRPAQRQQNTAAGPAGAGQQQQGQRQAARAQRQRPAHPADDDFESPYSRIVDPTVAQRRPAVQLGSPQQQQRTAAAAAAQRQRSSSLPEEVRKKLAAQVRWDGRLTVLHACGPLCPMPCNTICCGNTCALASFTSQPNGLLVPLPQAPVLPTGPHTLFWDSKSGGWGAAWLQARCTRGATGNLAVLGRQVASC